MKKRIAALLTVLALAVAAMIPAGIAEEAAEIVSPDPYEEIVAEFLQAKTVEPYQVIVRPTRVTGWANMNWAPSRSAPVLANYPAQTELTVPAATYTQDPATGAVTSVPGVTTVVVTGTI